MTEWIYELYPCNQNCPRNYFAPSQSINVHHLSGDCWQNTLVFPLTYLLDKYGLCGYRHSLMSQEESSSGLGHGMVLGSLCCSQLFRQIWFPFKNYTYVSVNLSQWGLFCWVPCLLTITSVPCSLFVFSVFS